MIQTIKKNHEFARIYKKAKSFATKHLVLYVMPNGKPANYIGISISKKLGKAVCRNRVRRLIKEQYRLKQQTLAQGFNMVIIVRPIAKDVTFNQIGKDLNFLFKKHELFQSPTP